MFDQSCTFPQLDMGLVKREVCYFIVILCSHQQEEVRKTRVAQENCFSNFYYVVSQLKKKNDAKRRTMLLLAAL